MGANIGTTITGQLVALDIGAMAPLIAFVGVAIAMFVNKKQVQYWAHVIAGLGILFIGMNFMSDSMMPLRDSAAFASIVANFSNPLIGILVGAGFTALIQSLLRLRGYFAGPGQQRHCGSAHRRVCAVRPEHRYLYHRRTGSHRHQPPAPRGPQ